MLLYRYSPIIKANFNIQNWKWWLKIFCKVFYSTKKMISITMNTSMHVVFFFLCTSSYYTWDIMKYDGSAFRREHEYNWGESEFDELYKWKYVLRVSGWRARTLFQKVKGNRNHSSLVNGAVGHSPIILSICALDMDLIVKASKYDDWCNRFHDREYKTTIRSALFISRYL